MLDTPCASLAQFCPFYLSQHRDRTRRIVF